MIEIVIFKVQSMRKKFIFILVALLFPLSIYASPMD